MTNDNNIEILTSRFLSGEASPEDAMALEDLASSSTANRSYFNNCINLFPMISGISTNDLNKDRIWNTISDAVTGNSFTRKARVINWRVVGIAASILIILAIGLLLDDLVSKQNKNILYVTEASTKTVTLKDGSAVTLSPNSSIIVDKGYGTANRKIKLSGSAYFSVIHDPSRSLIVDMGFLHIKDLGTKFSVINMSSSDSIFIKVNEGRVLAYDDLGASKEFGEGETAIYLKLQKKLQTLTAGDGLLNDSIVPINATLKKSAIIRQSSRNDSSVTPVKAVQAKTHRQAATPADRVQPVSTGSTTNATSGEYPYPSYASQYPPQHGYTPDERRALVHQDSIQTHRILWDMEKDGLTKGDTTHSFKLSDAEFIIDGQKQSDQIFQRYRKKYMPAGKENTNWTWSWSHNLSAPPPSFIKRR